MFNADWKHPQTGGLLSQIIVKEERQLRAPKPRVEVQNIWNPDHLAKRESTWGDVRPRDLRAQRGTLQLAPHSTPVETRHCRSHMLHERRMGENLQALRKSQNLEERSMGSMTPELYTRLHPTYGMNDSFATVTTSQLIGMGSDSMPMKKRPGVGNASFSVNARNGGDRARIETMQKEMRSRPPPQMATALRGRRDPREGGQKSVSVTARAQTVPSAFCPRPGEQPV
mmetsp:Transcript_55960/g.121813  ORF Transcript_55960/g.121813 Transcript_55960/m.121813 type:complete len:227 (+) Transcript_55960:232-912(+)|eukprot:6213410-Pleurochrysis_carterae.AAC.2